MSTLEESNGNIELWMKINKSKTNYNLIYIDKNNGINETLANDIEVIGCLC